MVIDALSAIGSPDIKMSVGPSQPADNAAGGASFEDALGQVLGAAVDTLKAGESVAIRGIEGAAPTMKVVEAVMDAQRSLQSVLAIRDKLVSAYQEVARMAI
ncbi:MAG: flagellar hook-basal body complex protein FliE [Hyphomicrobiales bacterium]|nr:flagellar hook-basal body complex protein FliE [Hyphomicrobiales bacterium]